MGIINNIKNRFAKGRKSSYKRGYAAAQRRARFADFRTSRGTADYELRQALPIVRAKSRWLARNSSSMKRFLWLLKINVIGKKGFMFKSRVKQRDGEADESLNKRVEMAWKKWCRRPSVEGRLSMTALLHQRIATLARDGEAVWEIVFNPRYHDGISLNPLEADYLDVTLNTIYTGNGNEIRMGVEVDRFNRPVAYHLLTRHPGDVSWVPHNSRRRYRRVPAELIIHTYLQDRAGQTRGEPWASTVVNSVKMLDGYREAETVGRRLRSAIMGFFKKMMPQPQGIEEMADGYEESDQTFEMSIEPGMLKEMPTGYEFDKFDPGGSQTDYAQFESQIKTDIAMGLNISVVSHGMETKQISYSSHRGVIMEDRDFYRCLQEFIIDMDMETIFPIWLKMHMVQDDSVIPPTRFDAIVDAATFRGRGWSWVDPRNEVTANVSALQTKQTSLTAIAAERGMDIDDLLDEIEDEQLKAENRGLTLDYNITKGNVSNSESNNGNNSTSDATTDSDDSTDE